MKQTIVDDVVVTCEVPYSVGRWARTPEARAKEIERWASDFEDFVRDHRSQDPVTLVVERVYKDICSHCHSTWEEDEEGPLCCNAALEEWKAEKVQA